MPALEQRHWDLIGLALVAAGIFLAFLIYLGWDGGQAGGSIVDGLRDLIGELHYLVPVALLAAGAVLIMRPVLPAVRPFRAAAACLFVSGCLGLAAGTAGLGPDDGGNVGEALHDATSALLGDVGSHIVAVFLFLAGVLLVTGASIAGVVKATGDSVTTAGRHVRRGAEPVRTAVTRRRSAREELEELETAEVAAVTRGRAKKQDFWSGAERFPDLYEGEEETRIEFRRDPEPEPDTRDRRVRARPRARAGAGPGRRRAAARRGPGDRRARRHARRGRRQAGGPHAAGPPAPLGDRLARLRLERPRSPLPDPLHRRREQARTRSGRRRSPPSSSRRSATSASRRA